MHNYTSNHSKTWFVFTVLNDKKNFQGFSTHNLKIPSFKATEANFGEHLSKGLKYQRMKFGLY